MKRRIFSICILLFFLLMLRFPSQTFAGASTGLLLWFHSVLPTLLPFMILSNLMLYTQAVEWIARLISPLFCRIFCVSRYGTFALLIGFLCGYPMGAKVTSDLLKKQYITYEEASYLLSFCNNTSPAFLMNYIILQTLGTPDILLPAVCISLLSPILCSFLFRRYYGVHDRVCHSYHSPVSSSSSASRLTDTCMMNAFDAITRVGGYMILFSVFTELATAIFSQAPEWFPLLLSSLEISTGIQLLNTSFLSVNTRCILSLTLASFGGWCCVAQTRSMISGTGLPIFPYIAEKLITAMVTSLLSCFYFIIL